MRQLFVKDVAAMFDKNFMPMGKPVYGVSFVPIHLYANGDATLVGKHCVVLGRERGGPYMGLLNFVGGKIEDAKMRYEGEGIAKVLFDEVLEEMHMVLTPALFKDMLLKVHSAPFGDGVSLMFIVHLKGISRKVWEKEHIARKQSNAPWPFVEFDSIEHVPLNNLSNNKNMSEYVRKLATEIVACNNILNSIRGVHRSKIMTAEVRADGKVVVK